ncbi:hypothetical protein DXG03_006599 [Asterophora parasitica]|uniref:Uncharacterized protein n=1 Tax=Asterophora parasitica TaxID=117018 RepID=A0A9P7FYK5_9AGAR|nr:hypothetical protein DXG03_006599 [Asterophora parasitica]
MDAQDLRTGRRVCIKRANNKSQEIEIGRYLSSEDSPRHPKNHCPPVLDSFHDPDDPETRYIVMPLLRPFDDPDFEVVGEVVDFVTQLLEVQLDLFADLTAPNIMMDGLPIFPNGWHFVVPGFSEDGANILKPLSRIDHPVRYYIIDFDSSVRIQPGESSIRRGLGGRDSDPPELSNTRIPFDQYKLDVFTLGKVFLKEFKLKFAGLKFLATITEVMMIKDFAHRPTAREALQHWYKVKAGIDVGRARWRLRKSKESLGEQVIGATRDGFQSLKYILKKGDDLDLPISALSTAAIRPGYVSEAFTPPLILVIDGEHNAQTAPTLTFCQPSFKKGANDSDTAVE